MERRVVTIVAEIGENDMSLKIIADDVSAAEVVGVLEMAKMEVFKENGNIADK